MDMKFRQFLLIILDDLSDLDRRRLHFVLGEQIPRRLRESSDISNTIEIFEHLIDSQQIFPYLVDALVACGKLELSKKLKEYQSTCNVQITRPNQEVQPEISITQSALNEMTDDEELDCGKSFINFFSKSYSSLCVPPAIKFYFHTAVSK